MAKKNEGEFKVKREKSEVTKAMLALNAAVAKRNKLRAQQTTAEDRVRKVEGLLNEAEREVADARTRYEELAQ